MFAVAVFEDIEVKGNSVLDILRLQPRNFVIISENLVANLEKVRHASVRQMYLCSDLQGIS